VPSAGQDKRHPIQVVAKRTGLSADVLRAWEKRYGVLKPARSEGGRRLYSDEDIEYLRLLRRATVAGRNVGQVAGLSRDELEATVREDEAAVAARADPLTGQAIVAFVTLKAGVEGSVEKLEELRNHVAVKIGPIAKPANIVFTPELPKTRSGKIMRRILRKIAASEYDGLGDLTTLAEPEVVERLIEQHRAAAR